MGLNKRGQFFSPDLIIAMSVFIFALILFFSASNAVFYQTDLVNDRKDSDEIAHAALNALLLSPGQPSNWENVSFSDVNVFGLVYRNNFIEKEKLFALFNDLNSSDYVNTKIKLGFGAYDVYLRVLGPSGEEIVGAGSVAYNPKIKLIYERIAYYDSSQVVLQEIVSLPQ